MDKLAFAALALGIIALLTYAFWPTKEEYEPPPGYEPNDVVDVIEKDQEARMLLDENYHPPRAGPEREAYDRAWSNYRERQKEKP